MPVVPSMIKVWSFTWTCNVTGYNTIFKLWIKCNIRHTTYNPTLIDTKAMSDDSPEKRYLALKPRSPWEASVWNWTQSFGVNTTMGTAGTVCPQNLANSSPSESPMGLPSTYRVHESIQILKVVTDVECRFLCWQMSAVSFNFCLTENIVLMWDSGSRESPTLKNTYKNMLPTSIFSVPGVRAIMDQKDLQ